MAPLRRDILHRAVIYEGDSTRLGLASSLTRYEVHGTHAKKRPQKGSGKARMGSKQSPINKGGGKTFGPKPRDFATGLHRKVYDLAWRTALSWRYRRGELCVVEGLEPEYEVMASRNYFIDPLSGRTGIPAISTSLEDGTEPFYGIPWHESGISPRKEHIRSRPVPINLRVPDVPHIASTILSFLARYTWGKSSGRTTFITRGRIQHVHDTFAENINEIGREARYLAVDEGEVDVKKLLETGRLVVEKRALDRLLLKHGGGVGRPIRGVGQEGQIIEDVEEDDGQSTMAIEEDVGSEADMASSEQEMVNPPEQATTSTVASST